MDKRKPVKSTGYQLGRYELMEWRNAYTIAVLAFASSFTSRARSGVLVFWMSASKEGAEARRGTSRSKSTVMGWPIGAERVSVAFHGVKHAKERDYERSKGTWRQMCTAEKVWQGDTKPNLGEGVGSRRMRTRDPVVETGGNVVELVPWILEQKTRCSSGRVRAEHEEKKL